LISYNSKEFETMQQEAIRRVREMQKKAQGYVAHEEPDINLNSKGSTSTVSQHDNHSSNSSQHNSQAASQPHAATNSGANHSTQKTPNLHQGATEKNKSNQNNSQHNNRSNSFNPFAQLFGSNLGGFNKYKSNAQNTKEEYKNDVSQIPKSINNILKDFAIDEEKLILLLLIYILYKNGADMKLVLALGYLLI